MALETVPMTKERGWAPRLSERYDPSKPRSRRFWTEEEKAIVRETYPVGGAAACLVKLPGRKIDSIYRLASTTLKLRAPRMPAVRQRHECTPELEQQIRDRWPSLTAKRSIPAFAAELEVPKWWLIKQAQRMGLTTLRHKEPPWTAAEEQLMTRVPLHDPHRAAQIFRANGFTRSPTSIVVKSKRLGLSRRYRETLSAGKAAAILGVDGKSITALCIDGTIKATRRESRRLPQQGGAPWSIEHAELRRYVLDHIASVDIRKVDKVAFVDLLTATPTNAAATTTTTEAPQAIEAELTEIVDSLQRVIDSVERSIRAARSRRNTRK